VQEGHEVPTVPDIVDDEQEAAIAECLAQRGLGAVDGGEVAAPLRIDQADDVGDRRDDAAAALLTKFNEQRAVEVGVANVAVVGERASERGLAVAGGACDGAAVMATASRRSGASRRAFRASISALRSTKSAGGAEIIIGTGFCRLGPSSMRRNVA
jgi:hypothetical protein